VVVDLVLRQLVTVPEEVDHKLQVS
jgi:hypothetical protein